GCRTRAGIAGPLQIFGEFLPFAANHVARLGVDDRKDAGTASGPPARALLGLQYEDPVPVGGRRVFLEYLDSLGIKIEQIAQAEAVGELAAAFDCLRRAGKVLLAETREHVVDVLAQLAKAIAACNVRASENGIDRLRFGLALDGDAVELQHRELVTYCRRGA